MHAGRYRHKSMNSHSNRAGSGSQRPEFLQVTVAAPTSENPGSHWKVMTEPSVKLVFWDVVLRNIPLSGGPAGRTHETICKEYDYETEYTRWRNAHEQWRYLLGSFLQTISPGFLSHSPVARQVAVIIPSGNSPSLHWKVTCVPGIAGTELSLIVLFCGEDSWTVQFIGAVR